MIRLNKKRVYYWLTLILLGIAYLVYFGGGSGFIPQSSITMTASQASVTKSAVCLVIEGVEAGKFNSTKEALDALYAELPSDVRELIIAEIGSPELNVLIVKLNSVLDRIEVK